MAINPLLSMSDDEIMGMVAPPKDGEIPAAKVETPETPAAVETPAAEEVETPVAETKVETPAAEVETKVETPETPAASPAAGTPEEKKDEKKSAVPAVSADPAPADKPAENKETPAASAPDYKSLYERFMAPIKANGKTIELKSPDEAIQLMQMGANYTKKMQGIAPYRKVLTMLENHGLLDETRLSFLIDLDKKNPEAIRKLVKDSGIDAIDLDGGPKTTYFEGNHKVSDDEVAFKTAVQELRSTEGGVETLTTINGWDQASKEVLWKNPDLMDAIRVQRENGIYDSIATEIDRRRTLGTIPASTPFLNAYKAVGDELQASGAFNKPAPKPVAPGTTVAPSTATPVVTRVATPKPAVSNNERVSAASSSRGTPRKADTFKNPLAMSDEEFMKQFEHRL